MEYNISSIAAVISPFQNEREICRKNIKNYFEIYLKSTLEERIKRDKKKLYLPAINGEKKNVIDVDIPFEVPNKCDLEIETDNKSPANIIEEILKQINI